VKRADTKFAQAERAEDSVLAAQRRFIATKLGSDPLLDSVSEVVAILNPERQIVYSNRRLLELLDVSLESVIGQRFGEVLGCQHATESEGGCGTTESCRQCGAIHAMLLAQTNREAVREVRMLKRSGDALDLRVRATPMDIGGTRFTIFAADDISDEKRREALERTFFHDVLNTAGNVRSAAHVLAHAEVGDPVPIFGIIERSSRQLINEISSHRILLAAERGSLDLRLKTLVTNDVLAELVDQYLAGGLAEGRGIRVMSEAQSVSFRSDPVLLRRVLGNLVKNALEATPEGGGVTLNAFAEPGGVGFSVHNPGFMPDAVQRQVFKRSFSTKGAGRGIGTFSVKLLTQRYLGGEVEFTSDPSGGTTFVVRLPVAGPTEEPSDTSP